ncbi:hypothetical protein Franean1_0990 [Parafrankia sp. EAN1pec]|nr:hypothetical protein Franean1_0990 [Frankia sp. EAN1pec]
MVAALAVSEACGRQRLTDESATTQARGLRSKDLGHALRSAPP